MVKKQSDLTKLAEDAAELGSASPATDGTKKSLVEEIAIELQRPNLEGMVTELALVDQAVADVRVNVLDQTWSLDEIDKFRSARRNDLKAAMNQEERSKVVSEETNWVAEVSPSFSETWNIAVLKATLPPEQVAQIIVEQVDAKMLNALISRGAISREVLEKAGAVEKKVRSVSLRLKPREANGS